MFRTAIMGRMRSAISFVLAVIVGVTIQSMNGGLGVAMALALSILALGRVISYRLIVLLGLICIALCPLVLLLGNTSWLDKSPQVAYVIIAIFGTSWSRPVALVELLSIQAFNFLVAGVLVLVVHSALKLPQGLETK